MKKIILAIIGGLHLLLFLVLFVTVHKIVSEQDSQNASLRWSGGKASSQISCFFSVNAFNAEDMIQEFEHTVDRSLADASVVLNSENASARLWIDTYSANGKVEIYSENGKMEADAIGIRGDFFVFHPLRLLSGSYFSGNDELTDYCVLDQDAAWQLFGSNAVAGQIVYIGDIPHMVTGVVERPKGKLMEAAGLDSAVVYLSYDSLNAYGISNGINHYEILMPNPVKNFAYNCVMEGLGKNENETEIIDNSSRYSLVSRLKMITKYGTRAMNGKAIIYPYWENLARGYEDILALLTLGEIWGVLGTVIFGIALFVVIWKNKGWTVKEKVLVVKDKQERKVEWARAKRRAKKGNTDDLEFLTEFEEERKRKDEERKRALTEQGK